MSIQAVGMRAYSEAVQNFSKVQSSMQQGGSIGSQTQFAKTLDQSLLRDSVDRGENFGAQADFIKYPTQAHTPVTPQNSFSGTIKSSLNKVNELDNAKNAAIEDFAAGRTQNVHELMITMQKAGLAMNMTAAVRNKAMEAYKELTRLQF